MSEQQPQVAPASKEGKGRHVQEKIMLSLGAVFFGGTILLTVLPEEFRGVTMSLITGLTVMAMFYLPGSGKKKSS